MSDEKEVCFIITPIGEDGSEIRKHIDGVIDEAISTSVGNLYEIKVSHRMESIGSINEQVLKLIYESNLVIANLTNLNPNVMYELAFRHSTGKPVITIAEIGTRLPFDFIDERTIFYDNTPSGMGKLRDNLNAFIENNDLSRKEYGPIIKIFKIEGYKHFIKELMSEPIDSSKLNKFFAQILEKLDKINYRDYDISNNLRPDNQYLSKLDYEFNILLCRARALSISKNKGEYESVIYEIDKYRFIISKLILSDELRTKYTTMVNESYGCYADAKMKNKIRD